MSEKTIVPAHSTKIVRIDDNGRNPLERSNRLSKASWGLVLRRTWTDFWHESFLDRAATMTYFTLMAFAPAVLAAYSIATLIFATRQDEVHELVSEVVTEFVPARMQEQAMSLVETIIGSTAEGTWALIISVLVSLFSASAYVRAFSRTANMVYGRTEGRGLIRTWAIMWVLTIVLVIGAVCLIFANILRDTIITGILKPVARPLQLQGFVDFMLQIFLPVWNWIRFPVTVILAITLIALLFHFTPNVRPRRFRWATLGSITALIAIAVVWLLFSVFLRVYAAASAYGALSTVMAMFIAVWIMNSALIVGIKLDAEVLRAKELQVGLRSERYIQAPPRSESAAEAQVRAQQELEEKSRALRKGTETTDSTDPDTESTDTDSTNADAELDDDPPSNTHPEPTDAEES
ncbi:YihY/virulence factor BrkB family protein [Corynebacterium sp.]|uniref:YihY/virulence factor BrkB family protein n=1 Tax=Corynebacterium sp. TaxID=1720 RepID=UPI0026DD5DDA|nr:YihY/virulence factor BrkB family protein [Corynebacterium sp.]MDO5031922.1 YihY/virulence factor BrkB family protein [Corynebacterium sp.]